MPVVASPPWLRPPPPPLPLRQPTFALAVCSLWLDAALAHAGVAAALGLSGAHRRSILHYRTKEHTLCGVGWQLATAQRCQVTNITAYYYSTPTTL